KLTEDQKTKIKEVEEKMAPKRQEVQGKIRELVGQGLSREEMGEKMRELNKPIQEETTKMMAGILTPEQEKRHKQIELQARGLGALNDPKVQEALKLTDEQKEQIKTISEDARKEGEALFQGIGFGDQEKFQAAMKKGATLRKESLEKAMAMLKDDQ